MIADARNTASNEGEEGEIPQNQVANSGDPKWEPRIEKQEDKTKGWAPRTADATRKAISQDPGPEQGKKNNEIISVSDTREHCQICGYNNHTTRECRKMLCEICGCNTHTTYDCVNCLPWNYGPGTRVRGSFILMRSLILKLLEGKPVLL